METKKALSLCSLVVHVRWSLFEEFESFTKKWPPHCSWWQALPSIPYLIPFNQSNEEQDAQNKPVRR
jgi:hypothetical protein